MNLSTILNPLNEMAYPTEFSMETLKQLPSYKKRVDYVQSLLPRISSGSSRVVFKIDDEKVLKVAKNKKGLAQNEAESDGFLNKHAICAKTFDSDDNGLFIEMEFARKVTEKDFIRLSGLTLKQLCNVLIVEDKRRNPRKGQYYSTSKEDQELTQRLWDESEFFQNLMELVSNYGYPIPGDFCRLSSWGKVIREGSESLVLIDFGLTKEVLETHY